MIFLTPKIPDMLLKLAAPSPYPGPCPFHKGTQAAVSTTQQNWYEVNITSGLFLWITSRCVREIAEDSLCNTGFLLGLQIVRYPKQWRRDRAA